MTKNEMLKQYLFSLSDNKMRKEFIANEAAEAEFLTELSDAEICRIILNYLLINNWKYLPNSRALTLAAVSRQEGTMSMLRIIFGDIIQSNAKSVVPDFCLPPDEDDEPEESEWSEDNTEYKIEEE